MPKREKNNHNLTGGINANPAIQHCFVTSPVMTMALILDGAPLLKATMVVGMSPASDMLQILSPLNKWAGKDL